MANKKDEFCFMCGSKVDDVDKLIEKYKVTDDEEIKLLKEEVINLLDDVDALFNQG